MIILFLLLELETAAALYNAARVEPAAMMAAIGRLVNGKFTASIMPARIESLEVAVAGAQVSPDVLGRLRERIGVRAAAAVPSRPGFLQISIDRYWYLPYIPIILSLPVL